MPVTNLQLPIIGMTCANCVTTIERTLLKRTAVIIEASVNLANEEASISFDSSVTNLSEIRKSLVNAGYGVSSQQVVLPVRGMTCANCAATIERVLHTNVPGIITANVNLAASAIAFSSVSVRANSQRLRRLRL